MRTASVDAVLGTTIISVGMKPLSERDENTFITLVIYNSYSHK